MLNVLVYAVLGFILVLLTVMTYQFHALQKHISDTDTDDEHKQRLSLSQGFIYTAIVLVVILLIAYTWYIVKDTPWEGHLMEWLNIVVRVMHITFGIAWIGASFYFGGASGASTLPKDYMYNRGNESNRYLVLRELLRRQVRYGLSNCKEKAHGLSLPAPFLPSWE